MIDLPFRNEPTETGIDPQFIDSWLLIASAIIRSFSTLWLTLALDHQRKHRSSSKKYIIDDNVLIVF